MKAFGGRGERGRDRERIKLFRGIAKECPVKVNNPDSVLAIISLYPSGPLLFPPLNSLRKQHKNSSYN